MYFISKNNKKEGPYNIEELKLKTLTDDMLIRKKGIRGWLGIIHFPELMELMTGKAQVPVQKKVKKKDIDDYRDDNFDRYKQAAEDAIRGMDIETDGFWRDL